MEGGYWHLLQVNNLGKAAKSFKDFASVVEEGLEALRIHQQNYNANGPDPRKQFQLIWWEIPKNKHWQPLKDGSQMNFLKLPESNIYDNTIMDDEQTQVAVESVKELLDLCIVQTP
jgi:hypothetical protein